MKNIVAICKLRLLQMKNNRKQLLMLLILPSLVLFFVQFFLAKTIEQVRLPIAFVDEDKSELSQELANSLASINALDIVDQSYDEAKQLLLHQDVDMVVYVEAGFEERILKAETNSLITLIHSPISLSIGVMKEVVASNVMKFVSNSLAANYVLELAKEYSPALLVEEEILFAEAWEKTNAQWKPSPPLELIVLDDEVMIAPIHSEEGERGQSGLFLLVTMILLLSAYLSMMSLDRKENAIFKRLSIHRVTNLELFLGHLSAFTILLMVCSSLPICITKIAMDTSRLLLSMFMCILFSTILFYSFSTLFVKKSLFASSSGLLILGSLFLSALSDLSPQRVLFSMADGSTSLAFLVGYFGIGLILSMLFLIISSRREREKVC